MVRAGATAPPARGVHERPQGDSPLSRASEEGPPPNGRVGPDISQDATMDDFHYAHVLIVEEDEDPAPVLLKAETDRPLVDSVYLQCETVVPFTHIRVHVFNPADGSMVLHRRALRLRIQRRLVLHRLVLLQGGSMPTSLTYSKPVHSALGSRQLCLETRCLIRLTLARSALAWSGQFSLP